MLGDFNSIELKLPRLKQQVKCPTRSGKTLGKCYVSVNTGSYKCTRLPPLKTSHHDSVYLIPKLTPVSKSLPTYTTKKLWSSANIDRLLNCLEETDWSSLLPNNDVNSQATVFTSYINFCIDECIPTVQVRERNDKPWMNGKIRKLIADRCRALSNNDTFKVRQLQSVIQKEMRQAKSKHAKSVEDSLKSEPSQAWKSLNSLLKLKTKPADCNLDPDELNMYYSRFEKFSDPPFLPHISAVSDFFSVDEVYFSLLHVNGRKSSGPDSNPPRLIKAAAHTPVTPIRILFDTSISEGVLPDEWKKANIKPVPKSKSACEVKDFRSIALTSTISKCLELLLVKRFQTLV